MRREGFYLGFIEEDTPMGWEHGCGRGSRKDGIALVAADPDFVYLGA